MDQTSQDRSNPSEGDRMIYIDQKSGKAIRIINTNKPDAITKAALFLSIAAVLLSILVLIVDNINWRSLNLGRIAISDMKYVTFRTVNLSEIPNLYSHYSMQYQNNPSDPDYEPNVAAVKFLPVAFHSQSHEEVTGTFSLTLSDLKRELYSKGYTDTSKYKFKKRFKPMITL